MGRADTPVRRILNYAQDHFCRHLPVVFVLTVIGPRSSEEIGTGSEPAEVPVPIPSGLAVRGLFHRRRRRLFRARGGAVGRGQFHGPEEPLKKVVVWLDPEEFHSTWLGNKAIYRTRMAVADGGELVILAPGVGHVRRRTRKIDRLARLRKYGYRTTPEIMRCRTHDAL